MKFEAEFAFSSSTPGEYPRWDRAEIALAGRSNVGKSSILNALTATHGLARTSKTPGRTRAINFFVVDENLALVDLPGYGYAKMSRVQAAQISLLMKDYLAMRESLVGLVLLVDARRGPEAEEEALLALAESRQGEGLRPMTTVVAATKSDKLRRSDRAAALHRVARIGMDPVLCSAVSGEGIDQLRRRIVSLARQSQSELPSLQTNGR
jgi:GTP-binding protein